MDVLSRTAKSGAIARRWFRCAAFWEKVLAAIDVGGSTPAEIAPRSGVSTAALRYWLTRRRRARKPEFLPIRVTRRRPARVELEVGGVVVRIVDGAEPAYVSELVRAQRSC